MVLRRFCVCYLGHLFWMVYHARPSRFMRGASRFYSIVLDMLSLCYRVSLLNLPPTDAFLWHATPRPLPHGCTFATTTLPTTTTPRMRLVLLHHLTSHLLLPLCSRCRQRAACAARRLRRRRFARAFPTTFPRRHLPPTATFPSTDTACLHPPLGQVLFPQGLTAISACRPTHALYLQPHCPFTCLLPSCCYIPHTHTTIFPH